MPLRTTVIGSYPKPDYLPTPDWFRAGDMTKYSAQHYNEYLSKYKDDPEVQSLEKKAIKDTIDHQVSLGIDVVTDGEIKRENYIFHYCRNLNGFDFNKITWKTFRNGATRHGAPTIVGRVSCSDLSVTSVVEEWRTAQVMTQKPVKVTIPGPMTIIGSTVNEYYTDNKTLSADLTVCINRQLRALEEAGCTYIQIDEPVMMRNPDVALDYGIDHLTRIIEGLDKGVHKAVHLCCGYPSYLDQTDYMKADADGYFKLANKLDNAGFDAVSIEDAHRHNDLSLLRQFQKTCIILGMVAVAQSRVETVQEIKARVDAALLHIPAHRLMLAPITKHTESGSWVSGFSELVIADGYPEPKAKGIRPPSPTN